MSFFTETQLHTNSLFFQECVQLSTGGLHSQAPHGDRSLRSLSWFNHVINSSSIYHLLWPSRSTEAESTDLHVEPVVSTDHAGPHGSLLVGLGHEQLHGQQGRHVGSWHPGRSRCWTETQSLLGLDGRSHIWWTHVSGQRRITADLSRSTPEENKLNLKGKLSVFVSFSIFWSHWLIFFSPDHLCFWLFFAANYVFW